MCERPDFWVAVSRRLDVRLEEAPFRSPPVFADQGGA
jgi:hypothetical protein